ncbi:unnamed protein product [Bursaphelenchus xylophilus]|uniref:(pine wood nematode) hypothetical protein n=1 Tax=Bursaphelenchus xylophilus TaxID=6326 RepID=A0A1I7S255_BURXY|nr:unnamed protein product [Bursaphelenchus xylophilus]CAG9114895.1 unnamed protein product [Bursaphelenchus xylophilus]
MSVLARASLSKAFLSACSLSSTPSLNFPAVATKEKKPQALPAGFRPPRVISLLVKDVYKAGMSVGESGKIAKERYHSLTASERKEYEKRIEEIAAERRKKFEALPVSEQEKLYADAKERRQKRRALAHRQLLRAYKAETGHPKQPANQYLVYVKKQFDEQKPAQADLKDFMARCAADWRGMSESEKKPYKDEADKSRDKYFEELKVWKSSHTKKEWEEYKLKHK